MDQPLIVAINGSPNVKGNTAFMLEEALSECRSLGARSEWVHCQRMLRGQQKSFCSACSSPCSGKCYEGKPLGEAYELLARADGILVGSPVYFGSVSGQLKAFWDKSRLLRSQKGLLNVVGGALSVGSSRFGGQETTLRVIHDIFMVHGMISVGDGHYEDDCGHMGAAAQRPAQEDQEAIKRSRILGKRVYQVAQATMSLRMR
ncbi:MAG TPA: flavodoxin family protein [Syntrophomonadaceae bacterium]|nr:flavodoxin family protein [Syntrophomonadaceae bacterium]